MELLSVHHCMHVHGWMWDKSELWRSHCAFERGVPDADHWGPFSWSQSYHHWAFIGIQLQLHQKEEGRRWQEMTDWLPDCLNERMNEWMDKWMKIWMSFTSFSTSKQMKMSQIRSQDTAEYRSRWEKKRANQGLHVWAWCSQPSNHCRFSELSSPVRN